MIHRRREGDRMRYGITWVFDKSSIMVVLSLPVWILPYSLFRDWDTNNILVGERLLIAHAGIRWSRNRNKFFTWCKTAKIPYRIKLVATREEIEDGVGFSQDLAFQDLLKGEFLG